MTDERRQEGQEQLQQGGTGQRTKGEGGGGEQAQKVGRHGGQQGGKAGLHERDQRSQGHDASDDRRIDRPAGTGTDAPSDQRQAQPRRERQLGGVDAEEEARMAPNTQGNLGTTQREWSGKDNPRR